MPVFDRRYFDDLNEMMQRASGPEGQDPAFIDYSWRLTAPMTALMCAFAFVMLAAAIGRHAYWYAWPSGIGCGFGLFALFRAEFLSGHATTRRYQQWVRHAPLLVKAAAMALVALIFLGLPIAGATALILLGPEPWLASTIIAAVTALLVWSMVAWLWLRGSSSASDRERFSVDG